MRQSTPGRTGRVGLRRRRAALAARRGSGDLVAMPVRERMVATVAGMVAVHCVRAIETALVTVPGIVAHEVTVGRVVIDHDGRASDAALRAAIALAGFDVTAIARERRLPLA